ncbi:hypothetical protein LCGC14_1023420 [marine sediment metagenome]|uniref:Zinc finger CHC2-type domain-containing protein n=1 Tax=marine sediment metagenome TaxID=412755 RepID=A0A0F9N177_9ZZZZ
MTVLNWTEIDEPIFEIEEFTDIVLDKVHILDIFDKLGIEYFPCQTGEFTHRTRCPLTKHLFGNERTASLFISEETQSFYCFGCNSGGTVIEFATLYIGKPRDEVIKLLAEHVGVTSSNAGENLESLSRNKKRDPEQRVATHVLRTGIQIREHLHSIKGKQEYDKWCKWANKRFACLDRYLNTLSDDDWKVAKIYYDKVVNHLKSR